jgi:hypothetical protein
VRDVLDRGRYLKVVEIRTHKDVPGILRRRPQRHIYIDPGMEPRAGYADRFCESRLIHANDLYNNSCASRASQKKAVIIAAYGGHNGFFVASMPLTVAEFTIGGSVAYNYRLLWQ